MPIDNDLLYGTKAIAESLHIPQQTCCELLNEGKIPSSCMPAPPRVALARAECPLGRVRTGGLAKGAGELVEKGERTALASK